MEKIEWIIGLFVIGAIAIGFVVLTCLAANSDADDDCRRMGLGGYEPDEDPTQLFELIDDEKNSERESENNENE